MANIDDYKRVLALEVLPISLDEIKEILWKHLRTPSPEGRGWCACMGAEPMIDGIDREIRALVKARTSE